MANVNEFRGIGTLVKDPEVSFLPSQLEVCKFSVAINRKYKEKEEVCFLECVCFGKQGANIAKCVTKGQQLWFGGYIKQDIWTDKATNAKRSKHYVVIETFQFLGGKSDGKKDDYQEPEDNDTKETVDPDDVPF